VITMMPSDLERVQYYNRHTHEEYVYWLLDRCNEHLEHYGKKVPLQTMMLFVGTRESVDEMVSKRLDRFTLEDPIVPLDTEKIEDFKPKPEPEVEPEPEEVEEKPAWVEAAEEVLEEEEEVLEEEEEVLEEEEEVLEEEEEAMIVPPESNPFGEVDYHSWTVRELQDECRERGLTIRGTKSEVVLRLRQHDEGITITQETESETETPSEEAVEETSDAPSEEAVTMEVTENDNSGQQGEYSSEEE